MTDAEMLIDIADSLTYPRGVIVLVEDEPELETMVEVVALALRFRKRPDVVFRALIENWNRFQIVRELH